MTGTDSPTTDTPVTLEAGVRVRTHPSLCHVWGNCARFAPDVYQLDEDGKIAVHLLDVPAELAYDAWLGAGACPEGAITVIGPPFRHWAERREQARIRAADRADEGGAAGPAAAWS
jgi:ferredoxin